MMIMEALGHMNVNPSFDIVYRFSVYDNERKTNDEFSYSFNDMKIRKQIESLRQFVERMKEEYQKLKASNRYRVHYIAVVVSNSLSSVRFIIRSGEDIDRYVVCMRHHCDGANSSVSADYVIVVHDTKTNTEYEISAGIVNVR